MNGTRKTEGARAFNRGAQRNACPYAASTIAFQDWMDGWAQQKAEFERRLLLEHEARLYAKVG